MVPVGVADGRAAFGCHQGSEGMLGGILVAVEEVFRIVDYLATVLLEVAGGVTNHGLVFLLGGAEDFGHMEAPAFAEEGDGGSLSIE